MEWRLCHGISAFRRRHTRELACSLSLFLSCEHTESSRLQTGRECPPETNHDLGLLISLTEKINLSVFVAAAQSMRVCYDSLSRLRQPVKKSKCQSRELCRIKLRYCVQLLPTDPQSLASHCLWEKLPDSANKSLHLAERCLDA